MYLPSDMTLLGQPIVCIDFETFSFLGSTKIIVKEFAAVHYIHGERKADILFNAKDRTGMNAERVRTLGTQALNTGILMGYNLRFDWNCLAQFMPLANKFIGIDVLALVRKHEGQFRGSNSLSEVCARYNIAIKPHIAVEDTVATIKLFRKLCLRYNVQSLHNIYRRDGFR